MCHKKHRAWWSIKNCYTFLKDGSKVFNWRKSRYKSMLKKGDAGGLWFFWILKFDIFQLTFELI